MALRTDNFRKILQQSLGIAQFYTFSLKEAADVLQAVPDGSVDLLFEKKGNQLRSFIGGTVLQAKEWPLEADGRYFGVRFLPGQCFLPEGFSAKELVNADIEISGNAYGDNLAEQIMEAHNLEEQARFFWKAMRSVWTGKEKSRDGAGWRGTSAPESMPAEGMCRWIPLWKKPAIPPVTYEGVLREFTELRRKLLKNLFAFRTYCIRLIIKRIKVTKRLPWSADITIRRI